MKKPLIIVIVAFFLIGIVFAFLIIKRGSKEDTTTSDSVVSQIEPALPIEERPYVSLTPRSDGHELKLTISKISGLKSIEYELVYLAGDVQRGVIGTININGESSITRDLLLGSCSKNVCKYDENVDTGTLTLKTKGGNNQKYELSFHLQKGNEVGKVLTLDEMINFTGTMPSQSYFVTMDTGGFPGKTEGKVIAGPFGFFTSGSKELKGVVQIKAKEIPGGSRLLGWNQTTNNWKGYDKIVEISAHALSVQIDQLNTFIVVSP